MSFNPNGTGLSDAGVFSLPYSRQESSLVLLPVPWEVTTSYGHGCSMGPKGILQASKQLDLHDSHYGEFYQSGIFQEPTNEDWLQRSKVLKEKALAIRDRLEKAESLDPDEQTYQEEINQASRDLNQWVYDQTKSVLGENKIPAVIGGDHSSPFGIIKALKEKYENLSILHIDAHHDLRKAYQGYQYSHASIMYNVIEELNPHSLVQLGIRDYCPEEREMADSHPNIHCFYDSKVGEKLSQGTTWDSILTEAFKSLSDNVYISFDIDGLEPGLCPNTGTPVPGGLSFQQMEYMLYKLSKSEKKICGFDLCEVSPESAFDLEGWDTNVGARVLFKLCGSLLKNNK